jgi:periplasmic copper chaperone A
MLRNFILGFAALLALAAIPARAQEFKAGDITIEKPWSRATPKGADAAIGFCIIRNRGASADKLVGATADFAAAATIHEMTAENGVMRMRDLPAGLDIPPNNSVILSPKGYHLMFTGLKRQLKKGETVKADLTFEHAGSVSVTFDVGGVGDVSPAKPDDSMKGMKM